MNMYHLGNFVRKIGIIRNIEDFAILNNKVFFLTSGGDFWIYENGKLTKAKISSGIDS